MIAAASGSSIILSVIGIVCLIVAVWALIDAAIRPGPAFQSAGQRKALWIILPIVGIILFAVIGGVLGAVYLAVIRPKVIAAQ